MTERLRQFWARTRLLAILLLTVLGALAWVALRRWREHRRLAEARRARTLQATDSGGRMIEQAEEERSRLRLAADAHAWRARQARARADRIAGQVERNGHPDAARLIREWNGD